jgi:hypothetical protein
MLNNIITLLIIFNFSLNQNNILINDNEIKEIILIGTARNGKGGALLVTTDKVYNENGEVLSSAEKKYTLEGITSWDNNMIDKKLIVKGSLIEIIKRKSSILTSSPKVTLLVKNPKWILAPEGW